MAETTCVLAFDMGGTYIKAACVLPDGTLFGGVRMTPSNSGVEREGILENWRQAVDGLNTAAREAGAFPRGR